MRRARAWIRRAAWLGALVAGGCASTPAGLASDAAPLDARDATGLSDAQDATRLSDAYNAPDLGICGSCGILGMAPQGACSFAVPCPEGDMFRIELSTGASAIPRDTTHNNGWDYTDASQLMVRIYGPACTAVMSGAAGDVLITALC
jgi:hypothetical protein